MDILNSSYVYPLLPIPALSPALGQHHHSVAPKQQCPKRSSASSVPSSLPQPSYYSWSELLKPVPHSSLIKIHPWFPIASLPIKPKILRLAVQTCESCLPCCPKYTIFSIHREPWLSSLDTFPAGSHTVPRIPEVALSFSFLDLQMVIIGLR